MSDYEQELNLGVIFIGFISVICWILLVLILYKFRNSRDTKTALANLVGRLVVLFAPVMYFFPKFLSVAGFSSDAVAFYIIGLPILLLIVIYAAWYIIVPYYAVAYAVFLVGSRLKNRKKD
jgi:hypothetical protein